MKNVVRRKWLLAGLVGFALAAGFMAWLSAAIKGPYGCGDCTLEMPIPDNKTAEVIRANAPDWPFTYFETGNVYIVCNATDCSEYVITDSGGIWGQKKQARSDGASGGGTSSSASGSLSGPAGYTPAGNASTAPTGSGTVIVKNPSKIREK